MLEQIAVPVLCMLGHRFGEEADDLYLSEKLHGSLAGAGAASA